MDLSALLEDGFGRIREAVHQVLDGVRPEHLCVRPGPESNTIAWLVWHLARVQDDHIAGVAGTEQVYTAEPWHERFALPFDPGELGYGQSAAEVAAVQVQDAALLGGYYDAVHASTERFLATVTEADLDRVVDRRWDPPVTLGVRLMSVLSDDLQHAGQAAYVRGMLERA